MPKARYVWFPLGGLTLGFWFKDTQSGGFVLVDKKDTEGKGDKRAIKKSASALYVITAEELAERKFTSPKQIAFRMLQAEEQLRHEKYGDDVEEIDMDELD